MATTYSKHFNTKQTPQNQPIPGSTQVANSAGGFSFPVSNWTRLERFLILGNEGGSYYASEKKLTIENATAVLSCIQEDGKRTVDTIAKISTEGRAPKNDPAIFALALCASKGSTETKQYAFANMDKVCRIGTHLFQFIEAVEGFRGWGRGLTRACQNWYLSKGPRDLAYQVTKYQQRNSWSHRDVLRLCHAKGNLKPTHQEIFHWIVKGWHGVGKVEHPNAALHPIWAFERAKVATDRKEIVSLINKYDLVRECIPTKWLTEACVWEALLEKMPLTAMVRNLATMTRTGLLAPLSTAVNKVLAELANTERLRKSRLHPVAILAALLTYKAGHGTRGQNTWRPVPRIVDALDSAFYAAFGNVESTGKRWLLALDISGSMDSGVIAGVPGLTPRVGSCAMAMVTAAAEKQHHLVAYTSGGNWFASGQGLLDNNGLTVINISPRQRLDNVCYYTSRLPMGGTDCAAPMLYALNNKIPVDVFVSYTDSESWVGTIHASQALDMYRQKMGIASKAICVGMVANNYTILDPNDSGSLNVIGFDTNAPQVMFQFVSD